MRHPQSALPAKKQTEPSQGKVKKAAFSLLELMIVLTMMVAIGAVAWPSLRRPMADSSVQQAANQLRAQITDCRQSAAIEGQPRLMLFEAGRQSVGQGPWNDLVTQHSTDAREATSSLGGSQEDLGGSRGDLDADSWDLPIDIVVDEVQFDQQTYLAADESSAQSATGEYAESKWYLPFLPNGQTRDAVIVLRDCVTGSRVALEIEAVTGLMRTQRLAAAEIAATPAAAFESQPIDHVYSR